MKAEEEYWKHVARMGRGQHAASVAPAVPFVDGREEGVTGRGFRLGIVDDSGDGAPEKVAGDYSYIVCDLDGTLCDDTHRVSWARTKEWDRYHATLHVDTPVLAVLFLLYRIPLPRMFITGRPERYRKETERWLRQNDVLREKIDNVVMRPDDDLRSQSVIKVEQAQARGLTPDNVLMVLEDRRVMVRAWRKAGFTCFHVRDETA